MKKWMYNALIAFFALMFLVSAGMLIAYFIEGQQQKDRYEDLSSLKGEGSPRPSVLQSDDTAQQEPPVELVEFTDPETGKTVSMLPEFKDLYLQNNDIVGWLKIPGTVIDAYAAGVPVISAKWESFADLIRDGETGIGYPFGDENALEEILRDLAEHRSQYPETEDHRG